MKMLFIEKTPAKTPMSPGPPPTHRSGLRSGMKSERVGSGRVRPGTPGSLVMHHCTSWVLGYDVVCGQPSPRENLFFPFFLTICWIIRIFFVIEFCIGYIKGSIWIAPKANNQCRCHFSRSLNCLLKDVDDLGWAHRLSPSSFKEEDGNLRRWQPRKFTSLTSVRQPPCEGTDSKQVSLYIQNAVTKRLNGSGQGSHHPL